MTARTQPDMHVYKEYGWLRGMNVIPSWAARVEEAWWFYDPVCFREEIALGRKIHLNCICLWFEFTAWMADPEKMLANYLDAVAAIDEQGMKTMPCLFNTWHDAAWDYGGTYQINMEKNLNGHFEYVRSLGKALANDCRILAWDLCNEPSSVNSETIEYRWLEQIAAELRNCGIRQPVTIGTAMFGNVASMNAFAPLCDVISCHPYSKTIEEVEENHKICRQVQDEQGKPMLCNECIPGCLDDFKRAKCAGFNIEALENAGWGWMGWGMKEGKAVSTRRDRYDHNGIDGQGFHAWFKKDGGLRDGLDFLLEQPAMKDPWSKVKLDIVSGL